ncbi:MAG: UTP--glucose-1-phosphate uridylyltransferase [Candidatus Gracilibacteria bacterium]|nr:UTP--glucose-1-phosphate uridylyltransferase [Candidatus Gracilibacteria bacterium]
MKAVIPVAGLGTRMLPASKACSKELLPIIDRPVLHLLVEELYEAGIREVIFVVGKNKKALQNYFKVDPSLEAVLQSKGQSKVLASLKKLNTKMKFEYVEQKQPLGDGDAVLCAHKFVKDEAFLVIFGDDLIDAAVSCSKQLIAAYKKYRMPVIALERVPREDISKYGIVGGASFAKRFYKLDCFVEKPLPENAPSDLAIVGKYLITPILLKLLKEMAGQKKGELRLIDAFHAMAHNKLPVIGMEFTGQRFDTGNKLGYVKAIMHYAMKDPELAAELKKYLRDKEF